MSDTTEPPEARPESSPPQSSFADQPAVPGETEPDTVGEPVTFGESASSGRLAAYGQPAADGQAPQYTLSASYALWSEPSPILVSFPGAAEQRRWTVAIRAILVIPQLFMLLILGIASQVVAVISWFAALVLGRLPEWAHTFQTGVLRWQARVYAYVFFLTDVYPPFSLDDEEYPVRLVTRPVRLNRLAVLFRIILLVPVAILSLAVLIGLAILSFFAWLITIVNGKLPVALREAVAGIVRYRVRYNGFADMVTSEYPKELFGDRAPSAGETTLPATESTTATTSVAEPALGLGAESASRAQSPADPWRLTESSPPRLQRATET